MCAPARALACDECRAAETVAPYSQWRGERLSFVISSGLGACARRDVTVGADGFCADILYAGVDVPFARHWRFTTEFGFGTTPRATSGDAALQEGLIAGGAHIALRGLLGWDITRLFFTRLGLEVRMTPAYGWMIPEPAAVAEIGSRTFGRLELGFRGRLGVESIVTSSATTHEQRWGPASAVGILVFARVFL